MNNTLKILATAIPMTFLAGCNFQPTLGENEFQIEKNEKKAIIFTCKADKPILIESITVNNNPPLYPHYDTPINESNAMIVMYAIAMGRTDAMRWQPKTFFENNNKTPIVFSCGMGQKDFVLDIPTVIGSNDIVQVTVKTTSHGTNTYTW